jgi:hypothetical protein
MMRGLCTERSAMAVIHFTEQDRLDCIESMRQAELPRLELAHTGTTIVEYEDAEYCEGIDCGEGTGVPSHSHVIMYGRDPETQRERYAILKP